MSSTKCYLILVIAVIACLGITETRELVRSKRGDKHWGYRNEDKSLLPKDWGKSHSKCYGVKQSPINVESEKTTYDSSLTPISIDKDGDDSEKWELHNNGHSIVLTPKNQKFTFMMNPENSTYKLLQMHFHWRGSEHYVNGHKFSAELHLVHQNVQDDSKFAVLGFLFSLSNIDNPTLVPILDQIKEVIRFDQKTEIHALKLNDVIPFNFKNYFRYSGSLTTPACDEVVEWFVLDNPVLSISEEQLIDLQSVEDKHGYPILTNVRPVQLINERSVRRSFKELKGKSSARSFLISASGHTDAAHVNKANVFTLILAALIPLRHIFVR